MNFISVPFKAQSPNGLSEYNGIAKFSPAGIVIEFEGKLLGLFGGEVKELRLSLDELRDIKFRKGLFKFFAKIQIRVESLAKISALPNEGGKLNLKIKREDFDLALEAVEQTQRFINGDIPAELESRNKTHEPLPPPKTSVNELFDTEKLDTENSRETNKLK